MTVTCSGEPDEGARLENTPGGGFGGNGCASLWSFGLSLKIAISRSLPERW
jgi:hypothetical protein